VNIHIPLESGGGDSPVYVATPLVEVKNLNSIRAVERAIKYEAERQFKAYHDPNDADYYQKKFGEVSKATAGWREHLGRTVVQRRKEEASDYRYFPEPDLVPVEVDGAWLDRVKADMGELPSEQRRRLQTQFGLSQYDANVLTSQGRATVGYFEAVANGCGDGKTAANWVTNQVLASLNERKQTIDEFPLRPSALVELLHLMKSKGLNHQRARDTYLKMLETGSSAEKAIADLGLREVSDDDLRAIIRKGLADNPKAVADFRKGNAKALDRIKGVAMKETKGMAKPDIVQKIIEEELSKIS
jgi:aspartyl-tRNA(Asn)/glutamyl-tRNA(Gln) amidotransferase subunit B